MRGLFYIVLYHIISTSVYIHAVLFKVQYFFQILTKDKHIWSIFPFTYSLSVLGNIINTCSHVSAGLIKSRNIWRKSISTYSSQNLVVLKIWLKVITKEIVYIQQDFHYKHYTIWSYTKALYKHEEKKNFSFFANMTMRTIFCSSQVIIIDYLI